MSGDTLPKGLDQFAVGAGHVKLLNVLHDLVLAESNCALGVLLGLVATLQTCEPPVVDGMALNN